jgi:hypothetical protein
MARFYFHVLNDVSFTPDEDGIELADMSAMQSHLRRILAELTADELALGRDAVNLCIMVDDDQGIRVADTKATTKIVASHNPFVAADRLSDS